MAAPSARLPWIDHLRTLVIVLVINMHACVTYSHVGDWYLKSSHEPSLGEKVPYIVWQAHLQSFFMGLLFLVSGYFAHASLSRRGAGGFVRERLVRLGLPTLFYMLVLHPFILLGLNPWHRDFGSLGEFYFRYLIKGRFLSSSGPLWFAFALLLFCLVLAAWRRLRPLQPTGAPPDQPSAPPPAWIWGVALALGLGTFAVRLIQPLGTSLLNFQLGYFVQYVAAFALGVHAARHGWLRPLALSDHARRAGWVTLVASPLVLLALLAALGAAGPAAFFGGLRWPAFALAVWEQGAGVGLSLGLLALFARRLDRDRPWLRWLSERSFAAYVLHAPVLVALAMAFRPLERIGSPLALIALLTFTGLVASFIAGDFARRVPVLRSIL
jgi:glucan biosynthesis protein C